MTLDEFQAEVFAHVEAARAAVETPTGDVAPAVFIGSAQGGMAALPIPPQWFGSREGKDRLVQLIAMAVRRAGADYVALQDTMMYSVVDVTTLTEEQLRQLAASEIPHGITAPLDDPNALERLQVVVFTAETTVGFHSQITRSSELPAYGPWEEMERPSGLLVEPIQAAMRR